MSYNERYLSEHLLKNLDRILFVTHLALGDFTYMRQFFKTLSEEYPNLKIDILVDDVRRTRLFWKWKYLERNPITEWISNCSYFNKVYTRTHTWGLFKKTIQELKNEQYSVVISLCGVRAHKYAKWSRYICPKGYVVGIRSKRRDLTKYLDDELPRTFDKPDWHIIELYATWFKLLFGLEFTNDDLNIEIPVEWEDYGQKFFEINNITKYKKVVFVNSFAKNKKRCWPIEKSRQLVVELSAEDTCFIINTPPIEAEQVRKVFAGLDKIFYLEARDNFFQLPSVIKECNLVISVETSVMHFASVLRIPIISLMRNKNPEWIPYGQKKDSIIFAQGHDAWVENIPVEAVVYKIKEYSTL